MTGTRRRGRHRRVGGRRHGDSPGVPGGFGAHGNPRDFQLMLGRLEDPGASELLEWLAYLRGGAGLPLEAVAHGAAASLGTAGAAVLVFPTWRWNGTEAAARSLFALDGPAARSIAVVIDAASFQLAEGPTASIRAAPGGHDAPILSTAETDEMLSMLLGGSVVVYRVSAHRGLLACLEEPIGMPG